jgi:hypothetical protein
LRLTTDVANATKFGRGGIELLGMVWAIRFECGEPPAEAGELVRGQFGDSFGYLFDFHASQGSPSSVE